MKADKEDWRIYYKLQYDRIAHHEQQRLTFSNIIVAITAFLVTFGFPFNNNTFLYVNIVMTSAFAIIINIGAIIFIDKSRHWIKFHQERARKIGEIAFSDISEEMSNVSKIDSDFDLWNRTEIQKLTHKVIIILLIVYPIILFIERYIIII
jgi:amino acid transporter